MDSQVNVPLSNGLQAVVSACDAERVLSHTWTAKRRRGGDSSFYAHARIGGKHVMLHRFIMQPPADMEVDRDNGDGLDNTRTNLKVVTHQQNMLNRRGESSEYPGVHFHRQRNKWQATARVDGRKKYLGLFTTPELASEAYQREVRK